MASLWLPVFVTVRREVVLGSAATTASSLNVFGHDAAQQANLCAVVQFTDQAEQVRVLDFPRYWENPRGSTLGRRWPEPKHHGRQVIVLRRLARKRVDRIEHGVQNALR
jgi:hypothetical protein